MMTDPVADMLSRIRNAQRARHARTLVPSSKLKIAIARALESHGYVSDVEMGTEGNHPVISIALRYRPDGPGLSDGTRRVSRPGRRVYVRADAVPKVRNGLGVGLVSTSRGVLSDSDARTQAVGGEFLCEVW